MGGLIVNDYFTLPQEVWDEKECLKISRRRQKDSYGSKSPVGYFGGTWGKTRYNGGCIRDGKWYKGEIRNLPIIPDGFTIYQMPAWGWSIKKND